MAPAKSPAAARAAASRSRERGSRNENRRASRSASRTASAGFLRSRCGWAARIPASGPSAAGTVGFERQGFSERRGGLPCPARPQQRGAERGADAGGVGAERGGGGERFHGGGEVAGIEQQVAEFVEGVRGPGAFAGRLPEDRRRLGVPPAVPQQRARLQARFVVGAEGERFPEQRLRLGPAAPGGAAARRVRRAAGRPSPAGAPRRRAPRRGPRARRVRARPARESGVGGSPGSRIQ